MTLAGADDAVTQEGQDRERVNSQVACQTKSRYPVQGHQTEEYGKVSHWKKAIWSFLGSLERVGQSDYISPDG